MGAVARLYAELGLDDRSFRKGMRNAKEGLVGLVENLTGVSMRTLTLAGALGAAGLAARKAVTDTVQYNKTVRELASITRLSTEETSRIIQVADDWGISIGEVQQALAMATKNGFAPSIDAIARLADQYVSITDPTERAANMTKIFGRNWAALEPILAKGGDAFRKQAAAIEDGLLVTEQAARASREFEIATDNLNDSVESLSHTVGNKTIPVLTALAKLFSTWFDDVPDTFQELAIAARGVTDELDGTARKMRELVHQAGLLGKDVPPDMAERLKLDEIKRLADEAAGAINGVTYAIKEMSTAQIGKQMLDDLTAVKDSMPADEYKKRFMDIATGYLGIDRTQAKFSVDMSQLSQDLLDGKISWEQYAAAMRDAKTAVDYYNSAKPPQAGTPEGNTPGKLLPQTQWGKPQETVKHAGSIQNDMDAHAGSLERGAAAAGDMAANEGKFAEHVGTLLSTLPPVNVETQTMYSKFSALNVALPLANVEMGNVAGGIQNMGIQTEITIPKLMELQGVIDGMHGKSIVISVSVQGAVGSGILGGAAEGQVGKGERRAAGGPVEAGRAYLVGERGPELFVPQRSGSIVSNGNLKGAGGLTVNNYGVLQVKSMDELTTPRTRRQQSLGAMR